MRKRISARFLCEPRSKAPDERGGRRETKDAKEQKSVPTPRNLELSCARAHPWRHLTALLSPQHGVLPVVLEVIPNLVAAQKHHHTLDRKERGTREAGAYPVLAASKRGPKTKTIKKISNHCTSR